MKIKNINIDENEEISVSKIMYKDDYMYLYRSIFSNCQSIGIEQIRGILDNYVTRIEFKNILKLIVKHTNRRQFIIDVEQDLLLNIKHVFHPFKKTFKTMKYESTNGSKMALCIIQIDITKIL